jgi:hypothetical protein
MLPSAYQLPAAAVLILGGALACFFGYRLFRIVLGVYGFILGALVASSIAGPADPLPMLLAAVVGGVVGALLLNLAYFVGVALIGAGAGALVLHVIWTRLATSDPHVIVVIAAAVTGAIAATILQRYVIIVATAFGGAWTVVMGAAALFEARAAAATSTAATDVWVFYPLSPGPGREWTLWAWLALSILGLIVQFASGGKGGRVSVRKRKK